MEARKCDEEIIKRPQLTTANGVHHAAQAPPAQHDASVKNGGGICRVPELVNSRGIMGGGGVQRICQIPGNTKAKSLACSAVTATMRQLQDRLRAVKVVCGDWSQVCGGSWQDSAGACGVFFDPPYSAEDRDAVYANESFTVAHDVRQWCLRRGDNPLMRIALCGYDTEHTELEAAGWKVYEWQTHGGYANQGKDARGRKNAKRERIWFSPHCLHEPTLFDLLD